MRSQSTKLTWRRTAFGVVALVVSLIHVVSASSDDEEGSSNEEPSPASTLNANKAGAIFTFLGASAAGVWLPYFIPVNPDILKFGVLFSAGLFISLALLELTEEAYEEMEHATGSSYPYGFLVVVFGIYLTWLCDIVVKSVWSKRGYGEEGNGEESTPTLADAVGVGAKVKSVDDVEEATPKKEAGVASIVDVALLLFALCFHAIFEGLAVGLQSTVQGVWTMAASVAVNEFFEGMALGVTLRAQDPDRRPLNYLAYSICASVVAPLGIVIGIIVNETASETARLYATGIGYGCAGGVFLFIGLSHLINKGMRASPGDAWWKPFLKWGVSGVGFAINACLMLW